MIKVYYHNADGELKLYTNTSPQAMVYHLTMTDDSAIIPSLDDNISTVIINKQQFRNEDWENFSEFIAWVQHTFPENNSGCVTISMEYLQELEAIRKEAGK